MTLVEAPPKGFLGARPCTSQWQQESQHHILRTSCTGPRPLRPDSPDQSSLYLSPRSHFEEEFALIYLLVGVFDQPPSTNPRNDGLTIALPAPPPRLLYFLVTPLRGEQ